MALANEIARELAVDHQLRRKLLPRSDLQLAGLFSCSPATVARVRRHYDFAAEVGLVGPQERLRRLTILNLPKSELRLIAKLADVAAPTVKRALHGGRVRASSRNRIAAALDYLGWRIELLPDQRPRADVGNGNSEEER